MNQIFEMNWTKARYSIMFGVVIIALLLVTAAYRNDSKIQQTTENTSLKIKELDAIKKFLISKINSPFFNIAYEIKNGDSIQKILKKYKVSDRQIHRVITEYKKYSNPNNLLTGTKIDIIIEKNLSNNKNSISKFSVPITKSTTIEIDRNEEGKIVSKKIITKLHKKKGICRKYYKEQSLLFSNKSWS